MHAPNLLTNSLPISLFASCLSFNFFLPPLTTRVISSVTLSEVKSFVSREVIDEISLLSLYFQNHTPVSLMYAEKNGEKYLVN